MSRNEEVITMITSLSRLFRISLSQGKTIITVREELEHAHHYLTIQQMRFKRKFRFSLDADEDTLECLTLKLVLQPLIENAIVHGIEYHTDEGCIEIRVYRESGQLVFRITDNGVGMTEEQVAGLLQGSPIVKSGAGSGVAVRNVHDRIQLYYGKGAVLNSRVSWRKERRSGFGYRFNANGRMAIIMIKGKEDKAIISRIISADSIKKFSPSILRALRCMGIAAAGCCLFLSKACGISNADSVLPPPRVALITPAGTGELAEAIRLGAEAAAKEHGAELLTVETFPSETATYAPSNPDSAIHRVREPQELSGQGASSYSQREEAQIRAVTQALQQGASALLVDPLSEKVLGDIIQKAQTMNKSNISVPVIVLNDEFPVEGITSVISMDNVEAGRQAGEAMAELLGGRGSVALLGPDPVNPGLIHREQGSWKRWSSIRVFGLNPSPYAALVKFAGRQRSSYWMSRR